LSRQLIAFRAAPRWLDELLSDSTQTMESLAVREGKSERAIPMTLTLAFLSPSWRRLQWTAAFRAGLASSG
jgi:hypothetical protein